LFLTLTEKNQASTFSVTTTNDSGAGSLRQAILDANANVGLDTITFSIISGVQTISPLSQLPTITDPVIIDGTTQPGFSDSPIIVINGGNITASASGLTITAGDSTVKGLAIGNFNNGAAINLLTNGGNTIQGNYIGLDASGTVRRRNQFGISVNTSNNIIGGTSASQRNVISGSTFNNLGIGGSGTNNQIKGNYIGTNATGIASLSDGSSSGVEIFNGSNSDNIIGGIEPGAMNLISGNGQYGIKARGTNTIIQGNLIGTDITGTQAIPNITGGVEILGSNILLGGTTPASRNIISGNGGRGVNYSQSFATVISKIQGNYIGVDITGNSILSNQFAGIEVDGSIQIGGTEMGAGNVISGNNLVGGFGGIYLLNSGSLGPTKIEGNYIGTNANGTSALGNNGRNGIEIASNNNIIGGSQPGAGNVISGNSIGIQIGGSTTATVQNNTIQGNFIGVDNSAAIPLPNNLSGIRISAGLNNKIGGVNSGEGNIIAYNNEAGVLVSGSFAAATGNSIIRNSIFQNGGLGIDLGTSGITANDNCDGDTGANNLQNFPVLASVSSNYNSTVFTGNLNSSANSVFNLHFYASPSPDASGNGEGRIYLGSAIVTTNMSCDAPINVNLATQNIRNLFITATATDISGNTSEFSNAVQAAGLSKTVFDYDGDGKTDISIFRPAPGEWWYLRSSGGGNRVFQFGSNTDKIVPADYTGDGITDIAFFRPASGQWFVLRSEDFSFFAFPFGASGDTPIPADFDGDGKADAAVFRESSQTWFIQKSTGGTDIIGFGAVGDKPVVADYDGDGKADIAIFRPNGTNGAEWWIRKSSDGNVLALQFGANTDKPVQGDYTGDGKADIAFWQPSSGNWFILRSEDFSFFAFPFGTNGDIPVPGDYDGDGKFDAGVFRPSNSTWFIQRSTAGTLIQQFGIAGDLPTPNAFAP
jgi:parallel beta-helix repeat protein